MSRFDIFPYITYNIQANRMGISDAQENGDKPLVARAIGESCGTIIKGFSIPGTGQNGKYYQGRDRANAQEQ